MLRAMIRLLGVYCLLLASACSTPPAPGDVLPRAGEEIVACGRLVHVGVPVVLWSDPGGYDAYRLENRFLEASAEGMPAARYGARRRLPDELRERVAHRGWTLEDLKEVVHLFVIHYDATGTSRRCFEILHDRRNLSVHFLLDVDGTLYQTLDLKERAWHATTANDHGIGIEIAHPGAFPRPGHPLLTRWYGEDAAGVYMKYPKFAGEPGVRTQGHVPRPARPGLFHGTINGRQVWQREFTDAQYRSLAQLSTALVRLFPGIDLRVPRSENGALRPDALSPEELDRHRGLLGHQHVQTNKTDPGPAFDWNRLLSDTGALLAVHER